jgi:hypothetical protein
MTRPTFGHPSPTRHRARPVHPDQSSLVLLTVLRGGGASLQLLPGGISDAADVDPEPAPVAIAQRQVAA